MLVIPHTFSEQWFSSDFTPVSYALAFSSLHVGSAASYISFRKLNNAVITPHAEMVSDTHQQLVTRTFVGGIGIMTLILFASAMLVCLCFNEQEGSADCVDEYSNTGVCCNYFAHFEIKRCLQPMTETRITLLMIANFLSTSAQSCSIVRMPDALHLLFPSISSNAVVAVYAASMGCGVLGCLLAVCLTRFRARSEASVIVSKYYNVRCCFKLVCIKQCRSHRTETALCYAGPGLCIEGIQQNKTDMEHVSALDDARYPNQGFSDVYTFK